MTEDFKNMLQSEIKKLEVKEEVKRQGEIAARTILAQLLLDLSASLRGTSLRAVLVDGALEIFGANYSTNASAPWADIRIQCNPHYGGKDFFLLPYVGARARSIAQRYILI